MIFIRQKPEETLLEGLNYMICRFCSSSDLSALLTFEEWCSFASSCGDERLLVSTIVKNNSELNFESITQCQKCDFLSVGILPDKGALSTFYDSYYANTKYQSKEDKKIRRATRRIKRLSKLVKNGMFLDVGCNLGYSVEAAGRLGYTSHGIDIDKAAIAKATDRFDKRNFIENDIETYAKARNQYDLVFCTEVIEHVIDFRSFAESLTCLLKKGGILYLTTPDSGHFRTPKKLLEWTEIKPPEHLQWFQKKHLKSLFESFGVKVSFQPTWKPGIRMVAKKP